MASPLMGRTVGGSSEKKVSFELRETRVTVANEVQRKLQHFCNSTFEYYFTGMESLSFDCGPGCAGAEFANSHNPMRNRQNCASVRGCRSWVGYL
jgi:hypothetical protein